MNSYIDAVRKVLAKGKVKHNRTGVDTIAVAAVTIEHDMEDGFPLLTTKKMPLKTIAVELEGFIKGITDKKWYKERGCKIWDEWSNPEAAKNLFRKSEPNSDVPYNEYNRKMSQQLCDDLGPIYGYQWRNFGKQYGSLKTTEMNKHYPGQWVHHPNGVNHGFDQFKYIVETLKINPNDRRLLCSAWNPNQFHLMALPPCHVLWNVVVIGDVLNLLWYQRSCDLMLGVPFNIASYALLLQLLAENSGLKPGTLHGTLADCHIYENHIEGANEQIKREPRNLPKLKLTHTDGIFNWTHKDLELTDYNPHPKISFGGVAI